MTERDQIIREVREQMTQEMIARFQKEKEQKLSSYRQQNRYIRKGETLFTGSSLMELFLPERRTAHCLQPGHRRIHNG